jgi:hypothetical protein
MHVHLLIPDLLLPPARDESLPRLPALELLLARGRRTALHPAHQEHWLLERFGATEEGAAEDGDAEGEGGEGNGEAACALLADGGEPGGQYWVRADPVHLRVDRDALVLADSAVFALRDDEARALADTLNAHFGAALKVEPHGPARWYAPLAAPPRMHCTPLPQVRGQPIREHLPRGADGMHWHALMNEVQMALHQHPVNEAREARGELAVNSLWFWGNGRRPALAGRPFNAVLADDALARGLGIASGASATPLNAVAGAAPWLADAPAEGRVLVVLDALRALASYGDGAGWLAAVEAMERDWVAPLLQALRDHRIGMLTCHLIAAQGGGNQGGLSVETVRSDLRRFWRRVRPLRDYIPRGES